MPPKPIKRKSKTTPTQKTSLDNIRSSIGPIAIGSLWAFFHLCLVLETSNILHSLLSPVYGSLPASRYHQPLILTALLISGSTYPIWRGSSQAWSQWLSVLLLSVPTLQLYLFRYSRQLGASTGPLISGLVTSFPLTLIAALVASKRLARKIDDSVLFDGVKYKAMWIGIIPQIITTMVSLIAYKTSNIFTNILSRTIFARSRLALYYLLATSQALISPSKYLLLAALPMLHTFSFSVYSPLPYSNTYLNTTLQHHGYSLMARQESITGYISVLDNKNDGFRVMRCDHSLLGGEWFPQPGHESQLREPVYAIFVMLEAVRLVQSADGSGSKREVGEGQKSALVVYVHIIDPGTDIWVFQLTESHKWPRHRHHTLRTHRSWHRYHDHRNRPHGAQFRNSILQLTIQPHPHNRRRHRLRRSKQTSERIRLHHPRRLHRRRRTHRSFHRRVPDRSEGYADGRRGHRHRKSPPSPANPIEKAPEKYPLIVHTLANTKDQNTRTTPATCISPPPAQ